MRVSSTASPRDIGDEARPPEKGYTTVANLQKYRFDSVDSTAWLYGNRGGYICKFNPRTGLMEQMSKEGCRLKSREGAVNNFNEWVKFSRYAEKFL